MEELKEGYTTYKKEPFVKKELDRPREPVREDNAGLAQSEPKTAEEVNLIQKTEVRMKTLIQAINAIESLTHQLNKNLLPQLPKSESEAKEDQRPPDGWLECHLSDLDHALHRCGQVYEQVTRLTQATKQKVGQ